MSDKIPPLHPSPVFSERPMNPGPNDPPQRAVTFPDVAMRIAHDGPMYAVIIVAAIMAAKGSATASESFMAAMGALLARSFPRAVQVGGSAVALALLLSGCISTRPAAYGAELQECTRAASTLTASLDCEDNVRARYGRPLLTEGERAERQPRDGGADGHP